MRYAFLALALTLAACSDSDEPVDDDRFGASEDAEPVQTPDGDTVYIDDNAVYGPCDILAPHKDDLSGWLDIPPPDGFADYGFACTG